MALDPSLLPHEKVGFPDAYRKGKEPLIWQDIQSKLTNLAMPDKLILDIGPGCSELPRLLLSQAHKNNSRAILCDSLEMLAQLPDHSYIKKVEGPFPDCWTALKKYAGLIDTIIAYSVLHYVFVEGNIWLFLDRCLELLAPEGQILIGDLPNYSKRARFFKTPAGIKFHQIYTDTNEIPIVTDNTLIEDKLDDSVIFALMMRARNQGFDAYVLPQAKDLPMSNRREDILIIRP
jgi:hypothetical protein